MYDAHLNFSFRAFFMNSLPERQTLRQPATTHQSQSTDSDSSRVLLRDVPENGSLSVRVFMASIRSRAL